MMSTKEYVEILTLNVMELRGSPFEGGLRHEDRAFMNGSDALI